MQGHLPGTKKLEILAVQDQLRLAVRVDFDIPAGETASGRKIAEVLDTHRDEAGTNLLSGSIECFA